MLMIHLGRHVSNPASRTVGAGMARYQWPAFDSQVIHECVRMRTCESARANVFVILC